MNGYPKAIERRCSRRTFYSRPLPHAEALRAKMEEYNAASGLHMRLAENDPWIFASIEANYGMFSGVRSYFAIVGRSGSKHLLVRAGYWGERLVLDAVSLGLSTCWVGGTYKKDACKNRLGLQADETLICVIVAGESPPEKTAKELTIARQNRPSPQLLDELCSITGSAPASFCSGMAAVTKAPTEPSIRPVRFDYGEGLVTAYVSDESTVFGKVDLGIAMLHFEVGSGTKNHFAPAEDGWAMRLFPTADDPD